MMSEVLVIGGGPVGLTLALLLARQGVGVTIVESGAGPDERLRAVSVDDECMRIWQACGVEDSIEGAWACGVEGAVVCRYEDERGRAFLELRSRTSDLGWPVAAVIHQGEITRALWREAMAQPGIRFLTGVRASDVRQTDATVGVDVIDASGVRSTLEGLWAVACDGGRSAVRRALGIRMEAPALPRPWLVANVIDEAPDACAVIRCVPGRATVTTPLPGGHRRIEAQLAPGEVRVLSGDVEAIRARLAEAWPGARSARLEDHAFCTFRAGIADRQRSGRVFLAGDAAHVTPPFAGQGLALGLRDASNLAFKLAGVCRGWLHEPVLETYEAERRPHQARMIALALRLGRVMSPGSDLHGRCVRLGVRALSACPPARAAVSLRGPGLRPVLRDGFLVSGGRAGRYLPQPHVRTASGAEVRFDALLGRRMTWVIARGVSVPGALSRLRLTSGDTVLIEGRDFVDASGLIKGAIGDAGVALVRPDRVIHTHFTSVGAAGVGRRIRAWNDTRTWDASRPRVAAH